jgi:NhaP-type Na+/H+ or K+/H+ antiporter
VLVGVAVGLVLMKILPRLDDRPVEVLVGVVAAYVAYLLAERLGVSGVLACVSAGLVGSRLAPRAVRSSTRLDAYAFWETLEFLLNGLVFILLGFQWPGIWREISDAPTSRLLLDGAVVSLTVIATRLLWVFPAAWLPRVLSRRLRARDPYPGWRPLVAIGWAGMRGAVSLSLALALPRDGVMFPGRGLIVYLTFCVILFTLVGQGLTLAPLLRGLGIAGEGRDDREELEARQATARAGLARVEQLLDEPWAPPREAGEHLVGHYEDRLRTITDLARMDGAGDGVDQASDAAGARGLQRLRLEGVDAERRELIRLRNAGAIDDDVFHRLERDLDLEEQRP